MNLYETKIRYVKIDEKSGKEKKVTQSYLVEAETFGTAEERIYKEMEACISGDFNVTAIRSASFSDIINQIDGDRYYASKVSFISFDEQLGKEKKVTQPMLVLSNSVEDATERIKDHLSHMIVPYDIVSVSESQIIDIFLN